MLEILDVTPYSIAAELGVQPGDRLVSINGAVVRDLIDIQLHEADTSLILEIARSDGEVWECDIEKGPGDSLGLVLPHPEPMHCGNQCIFCFVHQLPRGMRSSLYVKDEDYRFSYLYGAYVTLSNIGEEDVCRILEQQLSPLYVSVHATDETVREQLLGGRSAPLLPLLRRLVEGGITLHTQVVICPGVNDGAVLEQTFTELYQLAPGVASLALVPVGLTAFREHLPELRSVSAAEAGALLEWVHETQKLCLTRGGTRFLFAADELYLRAGVDFPPLEQYEDLPQIENGVGLVARFRAQANGVLAEAVTLDLPRISLVTGTDAATEVEAFVRTLAERTGTNLNVIPVPNRFLGGNVTVAGLITGQDIRDSLAGHDLDGILVLPDVLLRDGEDVLLDDVTLADLEEDLGVRVEVCAPDPEGLWDLLDTLQLEYHPENDF